MSKHAVSVLYFENLNMLRPENSSVLLVCEEKINKKDPKLSWVWELPGGKCCADKWKVAECCPEDHLTTAKREFLEETGLTAVKLKLLHEKWEENPETLQKYKRFVYLVEEASGELKNGFTPSGSPTPRWFRLGEFPRNSFGSHRSIIINFFKKPPRR